MKEAERIVKKWTETDREKKTEMEIEGPNRSGQKEMKTNGNGPNWKEMDKNERKWTETSQKRQKQTETARN